MSKRLGVLMLACTVGLAACSGGGPPPSKRPFAAYRQCLEQHGVTPRRPRATGTTTATTGASAPTTGTTNRPDPAAFAAARRACRNLRPAGGLRGGGINSGVRAAFRRCMSDHGVTLPGPGPGGAGTGTSGTGPGTTATINAPRGGMLNGLDRNDPTVAAALSACRSLLGSASTTTSTRK